jgi:hypothetical protein
MKTTTKDDNHKLAMRITRDTDKSPVKALTISMKTSHRACVAIARKKSAAAAPLPRPSSRLVVSDGPSSRAPLLLLEALCEFALRCRIACPTARLPSGYVGASMVSRGYIGQSLSSKISLLMS